MLTAFFCSSGFPYWLLKRPANSHSDTSAAVREKTARIKDLAPVPVGTLLSPDQFSFLPIMDVPGYRRLWPRVSGRE